MIREGKKLPVDILTRVPKAVVRISEDADIVALYSFGSLVESKLKPLSDLDFAVLLSESLNREQRFQKNIELIGSFIEILRTDEFDLLVLNDDPVRFGYNVIKTGKLLYCGDRAKLIDFIDHTIKFHLDFKPVRDSFDAVFLEGIGYHG